MVMKRPTSFNLSILWQFPMLRSALQTKLYRFAWFSFNCFTKCGSGFDLEGDKANHCKHCHILTFSFVVSFPLMTNSKDHKIAYLGFSSTSTRIAGCHKRFEADGCIGAYNNAFTLPLRLPKISWYFDNWKINQTNVNPSWLFLTWSSRTKQLDRYKKTYLIKLTPNKNVVKIGQNASFRWRTVSWIVDVLNNVT